MASSTIRNPITGLVAGVTLAAHQYKVVKFASTAGAVIPVAASTDVALGILQNDPTAGQPALIAGPGDIAIAIAGANNLAQGNLLGYNTTGQVIASSATDKIAQALEASTAVGDYIRVLVLGLNAS